MDSKGHRNVPVLGLLVAEDEFLSEEEEVELAEAAEHIVFQPGEVLIEEGSKPGCLFVLTSGRAEVRKRVSGHSDRLLTVLSAANANVLIGERNLLSNREASATVRALEKIEAIKIARERFEAKITEERPAAYKLAYRLACVLAERIADTNESVAQIAAQLEEAESEQPVPDIDVFRDKLVEWSI